MSWTLTVRNVPQADFAAAVDAAEPVGSGLALPGAAEDIAAAREAMKTLGARAKRAYVTAEARGHTLQTDEDDRFWDGLSVTVHGTEQPS